MSTLALDTLTSWSEPKAVRTKAGNRILRTGPTTEAFWQVYRANKEALKSAGISVGKDRNDQWQACWWLPDQATDQAEATSREASRATDADVDVPRPEGLEYLPYQKAGIAYAMARPAVLIGDEMGLGKTIQAIGIINADPTVRRVLVVCPASLKINWARELQRWLVRPTSVAIANGAFPTADIVIVNYDVLKKHSGQIGETEWDMVIVDECHYVKNPKAQRSKLTLGIKARRRVFLTGTPICNRPAELWTLVQSLDPNGLGRTWKGFHTRYAAGYQHYVRTGRGSRLVWDVTGASNLEELQDRLRASIMVRRLKKDVLTELPPKRRVVRELVRSGAEKLLAEQDQMHQAQEARRGELTAKAELALAAGDEATYEAAIQELRAYTTVAFTEMSRVRHALAVAKIPAVVDYLRESLVDSDERLVVFAHHLDVINGIMEGLSEADINCVQLTGQSSQADRQEAVDGFQAGRYQVFVGNIRAAGVGLTLTASSHVLFAELDWVPGNVSQAEDRCHRIGQTNSVLVEHLVFDESLDVLMAHKIIAKQAIIDQALDTQIDRTAPVYDTVSEIEVGEGGLRTWKEHEAKAAAITTEQIQAAHQAMQILAGYDPDHALHRNDIGFNAFDGQIGHSLANAVSLTPRQGVLAAKLANKYRRQLPEELIAVIKG